MTSYTYDAVGNLVEETRPNGTRTVYVYDFLDRVTSIEHFSAAGTTIARFAYTLDLRGNVVAVDELGGRSVSYSYNDERRLVQEAVIDPVLGNDLIRYAYDEVGNRVSRTDSTNTVTYAYDANDRLLTAGALIFTYDANGNTLSRSTAGMVTTYTYDFENRLAGASSSSSDFAYQYDADGVRVSATRNGVATRFLVDRNRPFAQVLEERDGDGTLLASYVYGLDLLRQDRGGMASFYHVDRVGSTRLLTDIEGVVSATYLYEAFGGLLDQDGSTVNAYRYTGEQFDEALGLYHLRARYLDPTIGRFTSVDPFEGALDQPESLPRYTYAFNDPVNFVDPGGEFAALATTGATQAKVRAQASLAGMNALRQVVFKFARSGQKTVRELRRFRRNPRFKNVGGWIHHLIEKRLLKRNKSLKKIFPSDLDIPGVLIGRKRHNRITAAWRNQIKYLNKRSKKNKEVTCEAIRIAAQSIYQKETAWVNAIRQALLSCND